MIRVAHFLQTYASTGENYVFEQVNLCPGTEGILLSERANNSGYNPVRQHAEHYKLCGNKWVDRVRTGLINRVFHSAYEKRLNSFFESQLKNFRPEVLHAHFGPMACKVLPLKRKLKLPMVVTFYGADISQSLKAPHIIQRYKEMLQVVDRVIVLFDEGVDRLTKLGCPSSKIQVWDIGIPIEEYPARSKVLEDQQVQIFTAARFVEKKGYPTLLAAFQLLAKKYPQTRLTVIGNGPLKEQVLNQAKDLGITDKFKLIDSAGMNNFFDVFKDLLSKTDVFVLPSTVAKDGDDEGGPPVVLTNAMATGVPIISTAIGGITRAIIHGETGLICKSDDAHDLFSKLETILTGHEKARQLGRNARQRAELCFDRRKQLQQITEVYHELKSK